jgi:hypothetical protein
LRVAEREVAGEAGEFQQALQCLATDDDKTDRTAPKAIVRCHQRPQS